jgi:hypothetical protein
MPTEPADQSTVYNLFIDFFTPPYSEYRIMASFKGTVAPDFYLWFFSSEVPTWASDSHPKIFSSFASASWSYLNLKFDFPLHHGAGSKKKIVS